MSDLIVLAYTDESNAEAAYREVQKLQSGLIVELAGMALVKVDPDGKTRVETPDGGQIVGYSTASGALFGAVIGLLFFVPLIGLVVGGALGALFSALERTGMNARFRAQVKDVVAAGSSAVVIYATKITRDKFAEALAPFGGTVVETSLSSDEEKELAHSLEPAR